MSNLKLENFYGTTISVDGLSNDSAKKLLQKAENYCKRGQSSLPPNKVILDGFQIELYYSAKAMIHSAKVHLRDKLRTVVKKQSQMERLQINEAIIEEIVLESDSYSSTASNDSFELIDLTVEDTSSEYIPRSETDTEESYASASRETVEDTSSEYIPGSETDTEESYASASREADFSLIEEKDELESYVFEIEDNVNAESSKSPNINDECVDDIHVESSQSPNINDECVDDIHVESSQSPNINDECVDDIHVESSQSPNINDKCVDDIHVESLYHVSFDEVSDYASTSTRISTKDDPSAFITSSKASSTTSSSSTAFSKARDSSSPITKMAGEKFSTREFKIPKIKRETIADNSEATIESNHSKSSSAGPPKSHLQNGSSNNSQTKRKKPPRSRSKKKPRYRYESESHWHHGYNYPVIHPPQFNQTNVYQYGYGLPPYPPPMMSYRQDVYFYPPCPPLIDHRFQYTYMDPCYGYPTLGPPY